VTDSVLKMVHDCPGDVEARRLLKALPPRDAIDLEDEHVPVA
jgi:hypothetical protein